MHLVQLLGGMELLPLHSVPSICLLGTSAGTCLTINGREQHTASKPQ